MKPVGMKPLVLRLLPADGTPVLIPDLLAKVASRYNHPQAQTPGYIPRDSFMAILSSLRVQKKVDYTRGKQEWRTKKVWLPK